MCAQVQIRYSLNLASFVKYVTYANIKYMHAQRVCVSGKSAVTSKTEITDWVFLCLDIYRFSTMGLTFVTFSNTTYK